MLYLIDRVLSLHSLIQHIVALLYLLVHLLLVLEQAGQLLDLLHFCYLLPVPELADVDEEVDQQRRNCEDCREDDGEEHVGQHNQEEK